MKQLESLRLLAPTLGWIRKGGLQDSLYGNRMWAKLQGLLYCPESASAENECACTPKRSSLDGLLSATKP